MFASRAFPTKVPAPMASKAKKPAANSPAKTAKTTKKAPKRKAAAAAKPTASAKSAPGAAWPAAPCRESVSARAHQIWIDEGRPTGKSLDHWLRAERELSNS